MAAQLVLNLLLNGLMALLLIVTTVYCSRLNKRIKILQDSKSELAEIIRQFDESTQRATASISDIHNATSRIAENMQHKIDKANYLADDLQFMIEKGNKLADRMDGGISANRSNNAAASQPSRPAPRPSVVEPMPEDEPEQVRPVSRRPADLPPARSGGDKAKASLDSMLKRVSGRSEDSASGIATDESGRRRPGARLRSKAEQELFDALKRGGDKA